jgi:hypothetical protein
MLWLSDWLDTTLTGKDIARTNLFAATLSEVLDLAGNAMRAKSH